MPSKVVGLHIGRGPEVHGCRRIFGPYVPKQLNQRIDVGVRL